MSKVIIAFADLQDDGHIYNVGDEYPRAGVTVSEERLEELASNRNRRGVALIVEEGTEEDAPEAKKGIDDVEAGVSSSNASEAKEKPRKRQGRHARTDS